MGSGSVGSTGLGGVEVKYRISLSAVYRRMLVSLTSNRSVCSKPSRKAVSCVACGSGQAACELLSPLISIRSSS